MTHPLGKDQHLLAPAGILTHRTALADTRLSSYLPYPQIPGLLQELYLQESAQRRALHNQLVDVKGAIRVFCRVRPLSGKERQARLAPAVHCDLLSNSLEMVEGRWGPACAGKDAMLLLGM